MISYSIMNRLIGLSFIFGAGCVCWSRVKLGHHTPIQVIVGALIGGLIGWIWFGIWSGFRLPRSILTSTSPSMMMNNRNEHLSSDWVRFDGLGGSIESNFDQSVELLIEAWKMRDGGLVWDGLGRPLINFIGHKLLGFKDDLIANGLPDGAMIIIFLYLFLIFLIIILYYQDLNY
ncbi:hypothetical protein BY996DRAFT_3068989 [Phakopsora pachyrhizi]|nr:hypothetical protein BY996DRAFT_3068989 [Phakopsora pachyrhizi]